MAYEFYRDLCAAVALHRTALTAAAKKLASAQAALQRANADFEAKRDAYTAARALVDDAANSQLIPHEPGVQIAGEFGIDPNRPMQDYEDAVRVNQ